MATNKEIKNAIKIINKFHKKIIILHCVSNYPTKISETNLKRINLLKKEFKNYPIGISDHTNSIYSSIASIPLGIVAIEKHFNIDNLKTPDSDFSINPQNLKTLKNISLDIFKSLKSYKNNTNSKKNIKLRRSIYSKIDIKKNDIISTKNIVSLRPSIGIKSENFLKLLEKKQKKIF